MDTSGKQFALQVMFVQLVFIYQNTACASIIRHRVDVHVCNSPVSFACLSADLAENAESYSEACHVSRPLRTVATAVRAICENCDRAFGQNLNPQFCSSFNCAVKLNCIILLLFLV